MNDANSIYYAYDGNDRLTVTSRVLDTPPAAETYAYTAGTNRLATFTDASGTRSISYDNRGNTIGETRPGGVTVAATYDGYGRLLTYTRTGDPAQANAYNGLDDRVSATSGSVTHRFVDDGDGRVMGEYGASASDVIAETIWLSPEIAANDNQFGGDDGVGGYAPLAVATGSGSSATLTWVHGNHLGVPIAFTDASGATVSLPSYSLPGFPGQTQTLSNLYYNRYRDYDSSTGRYIQADPIGLGGGSNPFLYSDANPLSRFDPWGLAKIILFRPDTTPGSLYYMATHIRNNPGVCAVYGHMGPRGLMYWNGQQYVPVWDDVAEVHRILMNGGCDPKQPVYFLGCAAGAGENPMAQQYASQYGVETVGATEDLFWDSYHLVGIWAPDPQNLETPDYSKPGFFKAFKP